MLIKISNIFKIDIIINKFIKSQSTDKRWTALQWDIKNCLLIKILCTECDTNGQ